MKKPYAAATFRGRIIDEPDMVQDEGLQNVGQRVHTLFGSGTPQSTAVLDAVEKLIETYMQYRLRNDPNLAKNVKSPTEEDVIAREAKLIEAAGEHTGKVLARAVYEETDKNLRILMKSGKLER